MSEAFNELFDRHAAYAMDGQQEMERISVDQPWDADIDGGSLTVGNFTTRIQVLASYSQVSGTLLWAWARRRELGEGWPEHTTLASKHIATLGKDAPEFSAGIAKLSEDEADDAVLIGVALLDAAGRTAVGVDAPAFYRGDHAQGSIYLLIDSAKLRPIREENLASYVMDRFVTYVKMGMPFTSAQRAFEHYARAHKLRVEATGTTVLATDDDEGVVTAEFDTTGKLTGISCESNC